MFIRHMSSMGIFFIHQFKIFMVISILSTNVCFFHALFRPAAPLHFRSSVFSYHEDCPKISLVLQSNFNEHDIWAVENVFSKKFDENGLFVKNELHDLLLTRQIALYQ